MKRRVKRYNEAGMVEGDEIPMDTEARRSIKDYMTNAPEDRVGGYTSPKRASFGEAFSEARRSGAKSFEYGGKRYTTEMASEKKRVRSTAPTPDESEAQTARLARAAKITESSKDKEGAPGYAVPAALAGAAATAAGVKAAMKKSPSASPRVEPTLSSSKGSGKGMPGGSLKDPYSMQLGSDLDVKRGVKRGMKRMGEDSGGIEFKKGGKIKKMAGGGSASSRADGIAQRGKTRGRIC
jgi:hypothetical protein